MCNVSKMVKKRKNSQYFNLKLTVVVNQYLPNYYYYAINFKVCDNITQKRALVVLSSF